MKWMNYIDKLHTETWTGFDTEFIGFQKFTMTLLLGVLDVRVHVWVIVLVESNVNLPWPMVQWGIDQIICEHCWVQHRGMIEGKHVYSLADLLIWFCPWLILALFRMSKQIQQSMGIVWHRVKNFKGTLPHFFLFFSSSVMSTFWNGKEMQQSTIGNVSSCFLQSTILIHIVIVSVHSCMIHVTIDNSS